LSWTCRTVGVAGLLLLLGNCSAWRTSAGENLIRGRAALRSGDYSGARDYFEASLKEGIGQEEAQVELLQTMRETGAYQEASRRSADFLSVREGSASLHLERGRIMKAVGEYAAAETHFRRSIALGPRGTATHMDAVRELAALLELTGRRAEARSLWDQLIEIYKSGGVRGSRQLGDVAMALWHQGYAEDARDIFVDATSTNAVGEISLETLAHFGGLFLEKYRATEALGVFRDCLKINPSHTDALVGIASAKKYENDFEVEVYARTALKTNPNCVPALNLLVQLALEAENYSEALKEIERALAVNPADPESLSLKAFYQYFAGDASGFAKTEKRVLEINPFYGNFYYTLAENLVSLRKYQEAVDFNRKAIAVDPELWAAHASLGMNLTRVGNLEEGRKFIQRAFNGDPFNVWAFNSLELFDQIDTFVKSRSEHFLYMMSREDALALASYASELAEDAYAKLTRRYGFKPQGPIQVEIYPDHGGFAVRTLGLPGLGGALGVSFGKVLAIDSPSARKSGEFNWGTTLWHEFAHIMTLQMTRHNIPRWYSEGLSVFEEHKAEPGWGDNLSPAFVKAYKEGKLLKASELNAGIMRPQTPEQIGLSYYQAALVCEMIEEKYGFEKIRESLLLFAENKPTEEVFSRTLGLTAAQMDSEYARYLDSRIRSVAAVFNPVEGSARADRADKGVLAQMLEKNPDDFYSNLNMGVLLRKQKLNAEAERFLKKAQTVFPQYVEPGNPYQLLGEIYTELKREDEALAQYIAWSRMDGNAKEPLLRAAELYRARKDWASAIRMLRLSVYIDPYDRDVQKKLGDAAMEARDWPAAITAYRVLAGSKDPDPARAHYDFAQALMAAGETQEAKRETLRALEIAPTFTKAQQLLLKLSGTTE
jgi:cellulose synthase operon protein C